MKFIYVIIVLILTACNEGKKMSGLPEGWKAGDYDIKNDYYCIPPKTNSDKYINIFGLGPDDQSHRIYTIPTDTSLEEIIIFF